MRATIGVAALAAATLAGQDLPPTKAIPPASAHAAQGVRYVDVTADAGLAGFRHVSGSPEKNYVIEVTGSGVATFDYDGDGLLDIYLVNGSTLDRVRQNAAAPRGSALPQPRRRPFPRRHRRGRRRQRALGTGRLRRRLRQRRRRGSLRHQLRREPAVSQRRAAASTTSRRARASPSTAGPPAARSATTTATDGSTSTSPATSPSISTTCRRRPPVRGERRDAAQGATSVRRQAPAARSAWAPRTRPARPSAPIAASRSCAARAGLPGAPDHLFRNNRDGTFTDVTAGGRRHRREGPLRLRRRLVRHGRRRQARPARGQRLGAELRLPQPRERPLRGRQLCLGRRARRQRPRPGAHGRRHRRLRQRRPRRPAHHQLRRRLQRPLPQRGRRAASPTSASAPAWRRRRSRSSAGARAFSTTTTTAGSICSSSTGTSTRWSIAWTGTRRTRSARCCSATWATAGSRRSALAAGPA